MGDICTNSDAISVNQSNAGLAADVSGMITKAHSGFAHTVNASMSFLYWCIGKRIRIEVLLKNRAGYGKQIVATLSQQLGWSHFKEILPLAKPLQRDYYAELCRVVWWRVRTLLGKVGSTLYERTAISEKPEKVVKVEKAALCNTSLPSRKLPQRKLLAAIEISKARLDAKGVPNE